MPTGNSMRYPSSYAGNDATTNYIRQQQNYIQQLQQELQNMRSAQYTAAVSPQPAQEEIKQPELTGPVRHADIIQIKSKQDVIDASVEKGTSQMFMSEDEQQIWIKSVDKDGKTILHSYPHSEDEDITESNQYVTKEDMKSFLSEAVGEFSKLIPSGDNFVRKDEIRDIIVETLSGNKSRKKEEE